MSLSDKIKMIGVANSGEFLIGGQSVILCNDLKEAIKELRWECCNNTQCFCGVIKEIFGEKLI